MNTALEEIADTHSTIAAISTPPGIGGIAVARLSGDEAIAIADRIWHGRHKLTDVPGYTAHYGTVMGHDGTSLDQAIATVYRAPHSFTGQNTVEIAVHGSTYIQRELINSLIAAGARTARPGEYTRRAFANGRIDLTQAEAIADIIASNSRAAHRLAMSQIKGNFTRDIDRLRTKLVDLVALLELELDFAEEDVEFADRTRLRNAALEIQRHVTRLADSFANGNTIKNGIPIAIVGATNAGKSSLLNQLVGDDRAIVSDIHGTTRDTIEETLEIDEFLFRFIDTAGLRHTDDPIEQLGIERSRRAIERAHITILVIDPTVTPDDQTTQILSNPPVNLVTVFNKSDLTTDTHPRLGATGTPICRTEGSEPRGTSDTYELTPISLSAKTGEGIDILRKRLVDIARATLYTDGVGETADTTIVTNLRHAEALRRASDSAAAVVNALDAGISGDLIAQDARATIDALSEITGRITSDEILSTIFSRFCIGK